MLPPTTGPAGRWLIAVGVLVYAALLTYLTIGG